MSGGSARLSASGSASGGMTKGTSIWQTKPQACTPASVREQPVTGTSAP